MKSYIAVLGKIDNNTTEEIVLREIAVTAADHFQAHKVALFKCNLSEEETVFLIKDSATKVIKFDHKKGFIA